MGIDYTPIIQAEMLVARLDLLDDQIPVLQRNDDALGWIDVLSLENTDWDIQQIQTLPVTPAYLRLRILETSEPLDEYIYQTEAVIYDGWRYKASRENDPFGTARIYAFKLDKLERL
jgi:hypothetical protein